MREVAIVGGGITQFGNLAERSIFSLASEACEIAMADAGVGAGRIENFFLGNMASECLAIQGAPAAYVARSIGIC